jgi:pimeloyl-ACP methyl ester carboxylesterase
VDFFVIIMQGFVLGQYGLTWALKHPERVAKLVILNTPLTQGGKLPLTLNQLRLPFVGEALQLSVKTLV